jgi:hypothetical protein
MKKCSRCDTEKPTSEYHKDRRNPTGLYGWCKNCAKEKAREYRANNLEKVRESQKRARQKRPHVYWAKNLRSAFGITLEDYERMFNEQKGMCAVCGCKETEIHPRSNALRRLAVDHCHQTGRVRGLLCNRCNRAIGLFRDDPQIISNAINYLER